MFTHEEIKPNTDGALDDVPKDFDFAIIPELIEQFKKNYSTLYELKKPLEEPSEDFALQQLQQTWKSICTGIAKSYDYFFPKGNNNQPIGLEGEPSYGRYDIATGYTKSTEAIKGAIGLCKQYAETKALLYPQDKISEALNSAYSTLSDTFLEFSYVLSQLGNMLKLGKSADEQFFKRFLTEFSPQFLEKDLGLIADSKDSSLVEQSIKQQVKTLCELMGIKEASKTPGLLDQSIQKLGTMFQKLKPQTTQPLNDQFKSNTSDSKPDQEKIRRFYNLNAKIKSLSLSEIPTYFSKKEEEERLFKAIPEKRKEVEDKSEALAKELKELLSIFLGTEIDLVAKAKTAHETLKTTQKELDFTATRADIPRLPTLKNTNDSIFEDLNSTKKWLNESIQLLNNSIERTNSKLTKDIEQIEKAQNQLKETIQKLNDYYQKTIEQYAIDTATALHQARIMGELIEAKDDNFDIAVWKGTSNRSLKTRVDEYKKKIEHLNNLFKARKKAFIAKKIVEFDSLKGKLDEYKLEDIPGNDALRKTLQENKDKLNETKSRIHRLVAKSGAIVDAVSFQETIPDEFKKLFDTLRQQIKCHNEISAQLQQYELAYITKKQALDGAIKNALLTLQSECQIIAQDSNLELPNTLFTYKEEKEILKDTQLTLDQTDRRLYNLLVLYIKLNNIQQKAPADLATYAKDLIQCVEEEMSAEKMQHLSEPDRCWLSRFFRGLLESLYLSFKTSSTWLHNKTHEDNLKRPCSYDFFKSQGTPFSSKTYKALTAIRKNLDKVAQSDSKDTSQIRP